MEEKLRESAPAGAEAGDIGHPWSVQRTAMVEVRLMASSRKSRLCRLLLASLAFGSLSAEVEVGGGGFAGSLWPRPAGQRA